MKTGRLLGLVVVAGIAIGALLSGLVPDLGSWNFGGGKGSQDDTTTLATSKSDEPVVADKEPAAKKLPDQPAEEPIEKPLDTETPPVTVVYVLIDGRNYLLRRGTEDKVPFQPASIEEVLQAAQAATGDDNGIRVRIEQKSSARETTEQELKKSLHDAGIPADSIRWKDEPVDRE